MEKKKIAILYIGTGRYTIFWDGFFKTCEKNFIRDAEKHYFFFTDSENYQSDEKVTVVKQENLGWPLITCLRYKILNKIREQLKDFDYIFFFNGNMEFVHETEAEEFLPNESEGFLVAAPHPLNKRTKTNHDFPFERNPKSRAFIPYGEGEKYYQACILGGRTKEFFELLDSCEEMMDMDLKNNIIPKIHDESVFNRYILKKKHKDLSLYYIYPTHGKFFYFFNPKVKIIQCDKAALKYGGHAYLRGESDKKITHFGYLKEKITSNFK